MIKNEVVCKNCHKTYYQFLDLQIEGFRERDFDRCPYCGYENGSSMTYEYYNEPVEQEKFGGNNTQSLYQTVTDFCHIQYKKTNCLNCNHSNGCPGNPCKNCKQCLEEIHYPTRYPLGRKDYDCERMLNFYVCDYGSKYASEMLYLYRKSIALKEIINYHVLSIGCGACPDLMALERYCFESNINKTISYYGIDVNEKWKTIHEQISKYKTSSIINTHFKYFDAVNDNFIVPNANVIILQYVISHFYNRGQIWHIESFFQKLMDDVIQHKKNDDPMIIFINDVNSNNRGRDYFTLLSNIIQSSDFHGQHYYFYFDKNIIHDAQRCGEKHDTCQVIFPIPNEFENIYQPWHFCTSAQLLIEVR